MQSLAARLTSFLVALTLTNARKQPPNIIEETDLQDIMDVKEARSHSLLEKAKTAGGIDQHVRSVLAHVLKREELIWQQERQ